MGRISKRHELNVNGVVHEIEAETTTPLLFVLRNQLCLNGPKYGCGYGECGTCTIIIDGLAARSCTIPVGLAVNHEIITLEGLSDGGRLHPIQKAFVDAQAAQCGYCLNGMIMTIAALLDRNPSPNDAEIRNELRFNLCRCGAHYEILEAVRLAIASMAQTRSGTL